VTNDHINQNQPLNARRYSTLQKLLIGGTCLLTMVSLLFGCSCSRRATYYAVDGIYLGMGLNELTAMNNSSMKESKPGLLYETQFRPEFRGIKLFTLSGKTYPVIQVQLKDEKVCSIRTGLSELDRKGGDFESKLIAAYGKPTGTDTGHEIVWWGSQEFKIVDSKVVRMAEGRVITALIAKDRMALDLEDFGPGYKEIKRGAFLTH
jgi:hypothetical protein